MSVAVSQWPEFIWSIAHVDWLGYAGLLSAGAANGAYDALQSHAYPLSSSPHSLSLIKCGLISLCMCVCMYVFVSLFMIKLKFRSCSVEKKGKKKEKKKQTEKHCILKGLTRS